MLGSSPRVRGTRGAHGHAVDHGRFIPARAGNAGVLRVSHAAAPVHPRACGERRGGGGAARSGTGSSPRVRGTRRGPRAGRLTRRFIPARAGNASSRSWPTGAPAVHPRACGERGRDADQRTERGGSSPRVRGTLRPRRDRVGWGRFIPARAGNATPTSAPSPPPSVHPRACGERATAISRSRASSGSSPRVRGTHDRDGAAGPRRRFIPARAGNARRDRRGRKRATVHPRACGERTPRIWRATRQSGSSPRVRGTRRWRARSGAPRRFIPARAGNAAAPRAPAPR